MIEEASEIKVTLTSGEEFEAKLIGADYESDLAVLKVDAKSDLPVAELGNSSDLMVGEWAIAIGRMASQEEQVPKDKEPISVES